MKKRLTICVFWDKEGLLRDYALFYIKSLRACSDKVLVVVNGVIDDSSKLALENSDFEVISRDNYGLDFGAYKHGLSHIGREALSSYDELILTNTTCYGPVYPFSEMFDSMDKRDCDFWGVTEHDVCLNDPLLNKVEHVHLQSYFLCFKNSVFTSHAFNSFFEKVINDRAVSYDEVVSLYEIQLTHFLEKHGFKASSYIDCSKYYRESVNPAICCTLELLKEQRLPLIKRKSVIFDPDITIKQYHGNKAKALLNYISDFSCYSTDLIYKDLIKDYKISDIKFSFHLNYVLPVSYVSDTAECSLKEGSVGCIVFVNSTERFEFIRTKLKSLPEDTAIYFVCKNRKDSEFIEKSLSDNGCYISGNYDVEYRIASDKTTVYEGYYITCKDVFDKYSYVCCLQTFDDYLLHNDRLYEDFFKASVNSVLSSDDYVSNILDIFYSHPYIGLLIQPTPLDNKCDDYLWGSSVIPTGSNSNIKYLRQYFNLSVPFDVYKTAAYNQVFWVRGKALDAMLTKKYDSSIFNLKPEPFIPVLKSDFDFVLPQIVQQSGFATGSVMPIDAVSVYIDSLYYNVKALEQYPRPAVFTFGKIKSDYPKYLKKLTFKELIKYIFTVRKTADRAYRYLTVLGFNILIKNKNK